MLFRNSKNDFDVEDIDELIMHLELAGVEWQYVRSGVVCTKMREQIGPCAHRSMPNPARCKASCVHRLEEAEYVTQVDVVLADIVEKIQLAQVRNDAILLDLWEGQLLTHIKRFTSLEEKWSAHATVIPILTRSALIGQTNV